MYIPKVFEETDINVLSGLMREFSFALLVTARNDLPMGTHVPVHLDSSGTNQRLLGHLARSNEHWQYFDGVHEAMLVFQGPHGYISPNWYINPNLVPTWNYIAIHAYGKPRIVDEFTEVVHILRQLIRDNENNSTGNWSIDQLPREELVKQLNNIVAFEMQIDRIEGKFKMNQNRTIEDAKSAATKLRGAKTLHADYIATEIEKRIRLK